MKRLAIEINGAGVIVADSERVLVEEPGYAMIDDGRIITGSDAYAQARIRPARLRSGFWSGLRIDAGAVEANGELAYEHLRLVWELADQRDATAVVVVPGGYDAEQLGLVLGIAQECGIQVEALVDAAVAASAVRYPDRELLYVDASLRTVTVSRIDQSAGAAVDRFEMSDATGLAAFADEMAKAIARTFVLETRFDPLHDASTEQALYDGLPLWLDALHRDGTVLAELEYAGETLAVELTTERVRSASLRLFREIAQLIGTLSSPGTVTAVQLNSRLAMLPGLCAELAQIQGIEIVQLERGAPAISVLQRVSRSRPDAGEVRLLRQLPFLGEAQRAEPIRQDSSPATRPTHIVFGGIGYRLDNERIEIASTQPQHAVNGTRTIAIGGPPGSAHCVLENRGGGLSVVRGNQNQLFVNDEPVTDQRRLEPGDVIRIGETGAVLQIVAVES